MPAMTPEELVHAACPRIADMGWAFFFDEATMARGAAVDLDPMTLYVMGRAGVLGDVEWTGVVAALGYFNPDLVKQVWNAGRKKIAPRDAGRLYLECAHEYGRARFSGLDDLTPFCDAAEAVVAATDLAGLFEFAALAAEPLPGDAPARAMQLLHLLRELRGSAHLVAVVASGLTARLAHAIKRPDFWGMFGWEGEPPVPTDEQRDAMVTAEELTDRLVLPSFAALDEGGAAALIAGLDAMQPAIAG